MNKITPLSIFVILGILFSLLFSSGQVENPDTHLRLTQTRIYIDEGRIDLPKDVGEEMHGNIAIQGEKRCMVYNPGQSLVFIPIYTIAKLFFLDAGNVYYLAAFLVSFVNMLIHSLCGYLLYQICLNLGSNKKQSYVVALVFCFTSYSLLAAQSTYEHHFEMFFVLLSFLFGTSKKFRFNALLAGIAISCGLVFRSTAIFVLPALLLLVKRGEMIKFFIGLTPGIGVVLLYNFLRFQNIFENGYDCAWAIANGQDIEFWSLCRAPMNLFGLMISPAKGLLIFSPTVFLGLFYFRKFLQFNRKMAFATIVLVLTYLGVFAMNFAWHGSIWSFGPRYILPIVPFLYLPLIHIKLNRCFLGFFILVFLGQILLMSVNYKRSLLSAYTKKGPINEVQYIYDLNNVPYLSQFRQLQVILPMNLNGVFFNYFPIEPWKKEVRTGPNEVLLKNSLEKTSVNFWWIRVFHERNNSLEKTLSLLLFYVVFWGSYLVVLKVKRYA
jgi:hypothetical protein